MELKTKLLWVAWVADMHRIFLPPLSSIIPRWVQTVMVSKLHHVILWWVPRVLLSQTQSWVTGLKNMLQTFLRSEAVGSERKSLLSFRIVTICPWWPILLDRFGLAEASVAFAHWWWFYVQIVFSSARAGEYTQGIGDSAPWGPTLSGPLIATSFLIITLPTNLSPFQNVTSSLKHLRLLIVVPVFTVLISCSWAWAGTKFPLVSQQRRNLAVSLMWTVCADEARGYFYNRFCLLSELFFSPLFIFTFND